MQTPKFPYHNKDYIYTTFMAVKIYPIVMFTFEKRIKKFHLAVVSLGLGEASCTESGCCAGSW